MLGDLIADAARLAPDVTAVVDDEGALSFAELADRVAAVTSAVSAETPPGARVAILAGNRNEYVECYYGVPSAGRILVPLHPRLHAQEWKALLRQSGASMLVGERDLLERLGPVQIPTIDLDATGADSFAAFTSGTGVQAPPSNLHPDDLAFLIGTSGTTGTPKLAMLSHDNFEAAVDATLDARPVADDDVLLTPFPLCHVAGYNIFVYHRRMRPVILMRRFDPVALAALVAEHHATSVSLAPTMIAMLLDAPDVDDNRLRSIRSIGYGASAIPGPVLRRGVDRWGCEFSQGYGMTELAGNAVFLGPDDHRAAAAGDARLLRSAGRAAPGVELRIASDGEVLVRARQVMRGYWEDPGATASALHDRWLHTGDIGTLDDDGLLTLVDRSKDIIVTGGENVASREVEDALFAHPDVADVAVVGIPDERWGEKVTAVVVARDGATLVLGELEALSRTRLAAFKTPREFVIVDALPRNVTGKVLKQQLREELSARAP